MGQFASSTAAELDNQWWSNAVNEDCPLTFTRANVERAPAVSHHGFDSQLSRDTRRAFSASSTRSSTSDLVYQATNPSQLFPYVMGEGPLCIGTTIQQSLISASFAQDVLASLEEKNKQQSPTSHYWIPSPPSSSASATAINTEIHGVHELSSCSRDITDSISASVRQHVTLRAC